MSDTNDMRRDFEALAKTHDFDLTPDDCDEGFYKSSRTDCAWIFWQAATERAAQVVEAMTERKRMNSSQKPDCEYAAAIRQGGAK